MNCLEMANNNPMDRTVIIPKGHIFSSMPIWKSGLNVVTLTIDGVLETSPHLDDWTTDNGGKARNFIDIG